MEIPEIVKPLIKKNKINEGENGMKISGKNYKPEDLLKRSKYIEDGSGSSDEGDIKTLELSPEKMVIDANTANEHKLEERKRREEEEKEQDIIKNQEEI